MQSSCRREVQESHRVFDALVSSIEQSHALVVAAVEEKERLAEKRVSRLVRELEREIQDLSEGNANQEEAQTEMRRWVNRESTLIMTPQNFHSKYLFKVCCYRLKGHFFMSANPEIEAMQLWRNVAKPL